MKLLQPKQNIQMQITIFVKVLKNFYSSVNWIKSKVVLAYASPKAQI